MNLGASYEALLVFAIAFGIVDDSTSTNLRHASLVLRLNELPESRYRSNT